MENSSMKIPVVFKIGPWLRPISGRLIQYWGFWTNLLENSLRSISNRRLKKMDELFKNRSLVTTRKTDISDDFSRKCHLNGDTWLRVIWLQCKKKCLFPMIVDPILPHAVFGPYEHRVDAPHFIFYLYRDWLVSSLSLVLMTSWG